MTLYILPAPTLSKLKPFGFLAATVTDILFPNLFCKNVSVQLFQAEFDDLLIYVDLTFLLHSRTNLVLISSHVI